MKKNLKTFVVLLALLGLYHPSDAFAASDLIDSVQPAQITRGNVTTLTINGTTLGAATGVTIDDPRIEVVSFVAQADRIDVMIDIGDRSEQGAKTVRVQFSDSEEVCEDAFTVVPGDPELFSLTPNQIVRGDEDTVVFRGLNLDAVTDIVITDGVTTTGFPISSGDPTLVSTSITVASTAAAGPHDVIAESAGFDAELLSGFTVVPGPIVVADLTPTTLVRGQTAALTLTGDNLDVIETFSLGSGVAVDSLIPTDPTELVVMVTVLQESVPVGSARNLLVSGGGDSFTLEDAVTVNAGALSLRRLRPNRLSQGAQVEVTIEGTNLDDIVAIDAGDGVAFTDVQVLSPTRAITQVVVDLDTTPGQRTVTVEGAFGEATIMEGLVILTRVEPEPMINFPDVIDASRVDVGARKRFSLLFINENDLTEDVTLELVSGDIEEFRLFVEGADTLDATYPEVLEFELAAFEERIVRAEFRPTLRTSSAAIVAVDVRGEPFGDVELRGTGVESLLSFSETPVVFPVVMAGETSIRRVSTLSSSPTPSVIPADGGVTFVVERNNGGFPQAAERTEIRLSDPLPPETRYLFGTTLLTIETRYPAGNYQGEIWVSTNRSTAPIMPLPFNSVVTPGLGGDDAGEGPLDGPPDAAPDMGPDVAPDTGGPDSGGDDAPADVGSDAGETPGDSGCCAQASTSRPTSETVLYALLLGVWAYRRRRT